MKLTIKITGPETPSLPSTMLPENAIFTSYKLSENIPNAIRKNGYRPLNAFDIYYDLDLFNMLPNCIGIDIIGAYELLDNGTYAQITNPIYSPLGDASLPINSGAPGILSGFYSFDDLGYSLNEARKIYIYDKPIDNGVVIKYNLIDVDDNPLPNICSLYIFANNVRVNVSTKLKDATTLIDSGGVVPVLLDNSEINMFDMEKKEPNGLNYNHNNRFTPIALSYINHFFPNLSHKYPPKVIFINDDPNNVDFEYEMYSNEFVLDGLLRINGRPIHYGQAIHTDKTIDGSLTLDTTNLLPGQTYLSYVTVEGIQSGGLLYTTT